MAPPIPGLRQPVQIRRRSPGDVLAGVGAIVLLVALTVGVPIALITVVGLPLPHSLPKLSALTSQLDINAILRILSVIIWLAWIQLVWCVLVEVKAAASHTAARPRVPLAGATQSAAHRLVTAALLLFTAAAALTPAVISHGPPQPAHSISAPAMNAVTPAIPVSGGLTAATFQKMPPNNPAATRTIRPSTTLATTRRPSEALCKGISMPGRFSGSSRSSASIVIPPSAGAGGTISGASRILGRVPTGSASSSGGGGGGPHANRGNSMIFAVFAAWTGDSTGSAGAAAGSRPMKVSVSAETSECSLIPSSASA